MEDQDAEASGKHGDQDGFQDELVENVATPGSIDFANAYFPCAVDRPGQGYVGMVKSGRSDNEDAKDG